MISWSAGTTADVLRHCGIDGVRGGSASTALRLSACGGPLPGALLKRGLIKTGLGRIQEAKKSSFEVDVGTTWSGPNGPGHTAHSYFVLISIWW